MTNVSSASFAKVSSDPNLSSSQTKLTSIAFHALKKNLLLNAQNAKRSWLPVELPSKMRLVHIFRIYLTSWQLYPYFAFILLGMASRMFCVYQLRMHSSRPEICITARQTLLRQLLRRTFRQEMYGLQQTYYRSWRNSIYFFWRPPLALPMFRLCNLFNVHGRQRLHYWRRGHHLPRMRQGKVDGLCWVLLDDCYQKMLYF